MMQTGKSDVVSRAVKFLLAAGVMLSFGSSGLASLPAAEAENTDLTITVLLQNYTGTSEAILDSTKAVTNAVFRRAGIEVDWLDCPTAPGQLAEHPACCHGIGPLDLVIRIHSGPRVSRLSPNAAGLGLALLSVEDRVPRFASVFVDRIEQLVWTTLRESSSGIFAIRLPSRYYTAVLLGHVIAHEMGHLLLGPNSHTGRGVMRTKWDQRDIDEAIRGSLDFTPLQVEQLQSQLMKRLTVETD